MKLKLVIGEIRERDFTYKGLDLDNEHKITAVGDSSMSVALSQVHLNIALQLPKHIPVQIVDEAGVRASGRANLAKYLHAPRHLRRRLL